MGGLASTFGIGGGPGAQGLSFQAGSVPIQTPVTSDQATTAYNQAQTGLTNQANFLTALQGQNGIGNQSSVYNQLQGIANGTGPNPAMAALNQATSANTADQAALMAGQRGAGSNVGLIARQAAMQGGANQQAAAGQAATMQAQQSLGALNQLGGLATQQIGQQAGATNALSGAQQSEQQTLLGGIGQQNAAAVQQQANQNNVNGQMAQAGAAAQGGVFSGIAGGLGIGGAATHYKGGLIEQNYAVGGPVRQKFANGTPNNPVNSNYNASAAQAIGSAPTVTLAPPVSQANAAASAAPKYTAPATSQSSNQPGQSLGQSGQQIGTAIGKGISALGSKIAGIWGNNTTSGGGQATTPDGVASPDDWYSAMTAPGDGTTPDYSNPISDPTLSSSQATDALAGPELSMPDITPFAKGGKVPAMVSPGERYLPPKEVAKVAKGEKKAAQAGEEIKGKAIVPGDSLKNDVVPKTLESGGVVLPRTVNKSPDRDAKAEAFVNSILHKHGLLSKRK